MCIRDRFCYSYAETACQQLSLTTAVGHCNNVCFLANKHSSYLALKYDTLLRARLSQEVARGECTSEKLGERDQQLVTELLNESLARLATKTQNQLRGKKKPWFGNPKDESEKKAHKGAKGKGKGGKAKKLFGGGGDDIVNP